MIDTTNWGYLLGITVNTIIFVTLVIKGRVKTPSVIPLTLMVVFSWVGTVFFVLWWFANKYPYLRYWFTDDLKDYYAWKESQTGRRRY